MTTEWTEITWAWDGEAVRVGVDRAGTGPTLLLLPALSSISTRAEMRPLQERLASSFATVAVDWPGFGDQPRPRVDWRPEAYAAFLAHLQGHVARDLRGTVAAGHAAGYVLARAAARPGSLGRLCLVAPTWRGPLPTMAGKRPRAFAAVGRAVDLPVLGPLLYRLNVNRPVVRMMARGHVYADPGWLGGGRLAAKLAVTRAPAARHASARFVAGELDPVRSREEFLALAGRIADPVLVVYGLGAPPKSRAEMEALAALPNVRAAVLPAGKLLVHEEFPDAVAEAVRPFLAGDRTEGRSDRGTDRPSGA
jgi:pimeloyl-ACP methyl ester carboxylesterase